MRRRRGRAAGVVLPQVLQEYLERLVGAPVEAERPILALAYREEPQEQIRADPHPAELWDTEQPKRPDHRLAVG